MRFFNDIIEKPQADPPSNLAVVGRYVFDPAIFHYLHKVNLGIGGEIQLTDAIKEMAQDYTSYGLEIEGKSFDISKSSEYVKLINLVCGPKGEERS